MLYSKNLLNKLININDNSKKLSENIVNSCFDIKNTKERYIPDDIIIWKTKKVENHPNADKLFVCEVDCWEENYQIITWGENIQENKFVPVALPWCYLPEIDLEIVSKPLRGVDSFWMICSKNEIWIKEDLDKHIIWLLEDDFDDLTDEDVWKKLKEKYWFIENNTFYADDIDLGGWPEMFGHFWLALNLKAIYSETHKLRYYKVMDYIKNFWNTNIKEALDSSWTSSRELKVKTNNLRSYIMLEISDMEVFGSDFFTRLNMMDLWLNPKNNWVDFSNLFMFYSGNPIHFFDADKVEWDIIIRQADSGEEFVDLFGNKYFLTTEDMVIADNKKILALAGIVGWADSWVDENTKNIIVEIGNFEPETIKKTWERHWIFTDSRTRFENNINPLYSLYALFIFMDEINYFHTTLGSYTFWGINYYIWDEAYKLLKTNHHIDFENIQVLLGAEEDTWFKEKAKNILENLGYIFIDSETIKFPFLKLPNKENLNRILAQDIVRIYWYQNIENNPISSYLQDVWYSLEVDIQRKIENSLVNKWFVQAETLPCVLDENLRIFDKDTNNLLENNLSFAWYSYLRDDLFCNMIEFIHNNFRNYNNIKIFEIGNVWNNKDNENYMEKFCGFSYYTRNKQSFETDPIIYMKKILNNVINILGLSGELQYFSTNYDMYHPKKQWEIYYQDFLIWNINALHPIYYENFKFPQNSEIVTVLLNLNKLKKIIKKNQSNKEFIDFDINNDNIVYRDLSFLVEKDFEFGKIYNTLKEIEWVKEVNVFDVYAWENIPEWYKSISFTIKIKKENNLTDDDITKILDECVNKTKSIWVYVRS